MRRPEAEVSTEGSSRGLANVVARSEDGVTFETLCVLDRRSFGADSLERPALVAVPGGGWRLYVSCATPGSKHWRVDLLEAGDPSGFSPERRRTVLPGDADWGVKDPVICWHRGTWHLWLCCHPLERDEDADRMVTYYGTSPDGIEWRLHGPALAGRPGAWDSRGARVTSVLFRPPGVVASYDGRASSAENFEERTGIAAGEDGSLLTAVGDEAVAGSPQGHGGLRYLSDVEPAAGGYRLFYERARPDSAHDLCTEAVPPPER
jgi:hypothetical protein